jgi:hypothetical protein
LGQGRSRTAALPVVRHGQCDVGRGRILGVADHAADTDRCLVAAGGREEQDGHVVALVDIVDQAVPASAR